MVKPRVRHFGYLMQITRDLKEILPTKWVPRVELRKVQKNEMGEFEKNRFSWVCKQGGCWLVRLVVPKKIDHCVLVDGGRGIIVDCAEKYPLKLSMDCLRMCSGSKSPGLRVEEVRQVVLQRVAKGKRGAIQIVDLD